MEIGWPDAPQVLKGGAERAEYGCIVTFERDDGLRLTIHRQGPPMKGLRQACAIALAQDESYRIISYSTPQTIMTDLNGRKPTAGASTFDSVEALVASQAGMRAMLHPRLVLLSQGRRRPFPSMEYRV
jgi:hypothetical protein